MAKSQVSKSQAVRDYIAKHPAAGPTEIFNALNAQGIMVSKGLVAVVKYKKPATSAPAKKRGRPATAKASAPAAKAPSAKGTNAVSANDLVAVKELADSLGGIAKTRDVLSLLEKLT